MLTLPEARFVRSVGAGALVLWAAMVGGYLLGYSGGVQSVPIATGPDVADSIVTCPLPWDPATVCIRHAVIEIPRDTIAPADSEAYARYIWRKHALAIVYAYPRMVWGRDTYYRLERQRLDSTRYATKEINP